MSKTLSNAVLFVLAACLCLARTAAGAPNEKVLLRDGKNIMRMIRADREGAREEFVLNGERIEVDHVFLLMNPARIVIDLKQPQFKKEYLVTLSASRFVTALRTGKHPQHTRIVLDIKTPEVPAYDWKKDTHGLHVTIGGDSKTKPATKISTPPSNPARAASPTTSPSGELASSTKPVAVLGAKRHEEPAQTPRPPAATPTPAAAAPPPIRTSPPATPAAKLEDQTTPDEESFLRLQAISFAYEDPGHKPLLKLKLNNRAKYSMSKKTDRQYVLTIQKCAVAWPHLELPHFPPHDFKGFTMVLVDRDAGSLQVTIGVQRGTRLNAVPVGSEVLVRAEP